MKKILLVLASVVAFAGPAFAFVKGVPTVQGVPNGTSLPVAQVVDTATGTIAAANDTVTLNLSGATSGFSVQISGTYSGIVNFERTNDGVNWRGVLATESSTQFQGGSNGPGTWVGNAAGALAVRAIANSTWTSGTATITIRATNGTGSVYVQNALRVFDATSQVSLAIKPGSTAPVSTDTAAVVALRDVAVDSTLKTLRTSSRPPEALGCYEIAGNASYTATTASGIIFSFRWGDATRLALILKVQTQVVATAFTTAGLVERQLVVVRSFTASDTGGTSILPTGSRAKLRTSFGTTLATDIRVGGFLSAGTGTADPQPIATTAAWMGAAGNVIGGANLVTLLDATTGPNPYPLVLAQNEGFRVQLGAAETASTRQTFVNVVWCEANAY